MKPKLKVFENFSESILPHEAHYLSKLSNFQDVGKLDIFNKVIYNAINPGNLKEFDDTLDKRKYHYIKSWIEAKLALIDVDKIGNWLLDFKRKLFLDLISAREEKEILLYVQEYKTIGFNFVNLYEIMKEYRSYLMIRLRYEDHQIIKDFLENFESAYEKSRAIQEKLYQATIDITQQYTSKSTDFIYWEKWLHKVFSSQGINGSSRYKAFILLAFLYNSESNTDKLQKIFDEIDVFFSNGEMYCRRLLYNYYSSRILLHSKQNDLENAIFYGKLSVRHRNEDTLMYVNNLVSILIRDNQFIEAKKLLDEHQNKFESSHNDYRRITFMSYTIRVLTELNQLQKAENLAVYFLKKFEEEILNYRWHHFLTSYINVLLKFEKYDQIVELEKRFNLIDREARRKKKSDYIPNLSWSVLLAKYMENKSSKELMLSQINSTFTDMKVTETNKNFLIKTSNLLSKNLPELSKLFKSHLV